MRSASSAAPVAAASMRIAHIVPSIAPQHGGPSVSVPALAASLDQLGHDVSLLSTGEPDPGRERAGRMVTRIFPRGWPPRLCPSAGLRAYLQKLDVDILHSHGLWLRTLHYAHHRAARSGARHVIAPRGMMAPWAWEHHRWKKTLANRLIHPGALAAAHGWHATSEAEADDIRAHGFSQPICVAPNGVSTPTPQKIAAATAYWRGLCPEAFQRPTALFYSRLHPKKRVIELIDLWLTTAPSDWLLLVVGIPETYTVDQLEDYVHRSSGAGRIRIFDGTDVPPPYVAASLFLFPSHSENFGLVVAEALAHGLPALVTDTTPWRTLQGSGFGWCVSWDEFAPALKASLSTPLELLQQQGTAARAWVLQKYSWEKSAQLLADFYRQLPEH